VKRSLNDTKNDLDRPCSLILRKPMRWFVTFPKVLPASRLAKAIPQLGMLLQEMNKLTEARVAYQQALELDPTLTVAKESLAVLQRSDK
jgi:tetratricopeptide (TPR) repeat protein